MNAHLSSTPGRESQFDYRVTGSRIVAALVDFIPLVVLFAVMAALRGEVEAEGLSYSATLHGWPFLHFLALTLVYYVLSEGFIGTTAGKMLLGLKVVRLDGKPYGWKAVLIRNLLRAVDGPPFCFVGIVTIWMTKRRQRLGDLAARTQVVRVVLHPQAAPTDTQLPPSAPLAPTDAKWKVPLVPRLTVALLLFVLISGLTIYISPRTTVPTAAPPKAPPRDEELRRLTTDSLLAFDRAVQARDFTAFHAHVAELWRRQTTAEELAEAFEPFISNQVSIAGVKHIAPLFDTPLAMNEQGLLVLSGYVPTTPLFVRFTLTYTYEHPEWKLVGIQVNLQDGDYQKAIADYTEVIRLEAQNVGAYVGRGLASELSGDYDKAIADYTEAIRLEAENAVAYLNRGDAWRAKGEHDKAIADYTEVIRLNPKYGIAYSNRGVAYASKGEFDPAVADFTQAIRLNPEFAKAHYNRGVAYASKGEFDRAIADYTEAIRVNPEYATAYTQIAWLLATCPTVELRNPSRAVELAEKAVKLEPEETGYWNTLGVAQYRAGDPQAAIQSLEKSVKLSSGGNSYDWFFLAMAHWQRGEKDEARSWYDKAVEWIEANQPDDEELIRFRAEAAELLGITATPTGEG